MLLVIAVALVAILAVLVATILPAQPDIACPDAWKVVAFAAMLEMLVLIKPVFDVIALVFAPEPETNSPETKSI